MNKVISEAHSFFKKNQKKIKEDFQQNENANVFSSLTLNVEEDTFINNIIYSECELSNVKPSLKLVENVKTLTHQIKVIQKQGALLIGEKIFKVRELLSQMKLPNTTFTSWINYVFPTKSSAYNALAYYELFSTLPTKDDKSIFQKLPYRTAYALASRKASVTDKIIVLKKINGLPNSKAITILNEYIPPLHKQSYISDKTVLSFHEINKEMSEKILDVLFFMNLRDDISSYNKNLIQQIYDISLTKKETDQ